MKRGLQKGWVWGKKGDYRPRLCSSIIAGVARADKADDIGRAIRRYDAGQIAHAVMDELIGTMLEILEVLVRNVHLSDGYV